MGQKKEADQRKDLSDLAARKKNREGNLDKETENTDALNKEDASEDARHFTKEFPPPTLTEATDPTSARNLDTKLRTPRVQVPSTSSTARTPPSSPEEAQPKRPIVVLESAAPATQSSGTKMKPNAEIEATVGKALADKGNESQGRGKAEDYREERKYAKQMQRDEDESGEDYYFEKKGLDNTFFFNKEACLMCTKDRAKVYDYMRLKAPWERDSKLSKMAYDT